MNPFESFITWILSLIYRLWLGGAYIVGIIEDIFLMFVGINPVYSAGQQANNQEGGFSDITSMIINNRGIREIFSNLIVFAVIMLIFFTILQIIREHYKDKDGGNPYKLVFRMVKAMLLFIIVTASCVIGLWASNVVLRALYRATGGGEAGIGGTIFIAMASSANRVQQGIDGDGVGNRNLFSAVTATSTTSKEWAWFEDLPKIWYGGNPDSLFEGGMGCTHILHFLGSWSHNCASKETVRERSTFGELIDAPSDLERYYVPAPGETGTKITTTTSGEYLYSQIIRFDVTELKHTATENSNKDYAAVRDFQGKNSWHKEDEIYTQSLNIHVVDTSGKAQTVARSGSNTNTKKEHKGFLRLSGRQMPSSWVDSSLDDINGLPDEAGRWGSSNSGTYHYYAITLNSQGKPISSVLRQYGNLSGSYFYFSPDTSIGTVAHETMLAYYQRTALGQSSPTAFYSLSQDAKDKYANWIDNMMRRRRGTTLGSDVTENLVLHDDTNLFSSKIEVKGPMRYTNPSAVNALYSVLDFNWIFGFGGLFIALGVYNGFAFGMIQRIAELGILYVFSPVTLAFFPFDDGAQFNNAFVKPFYKKAISSFAPVLSLNLFFAILPAFDSIVWFGGFTGSGLMNSLASCLVSIALLSMLPKVRTTIQTMLGADPMEEKKFFGKGSIMDNARKSVGLTSKNAARLQKFGQASALWAKDRAENKTARLKRIAARNAQLGISGAAGKGIRGSFNRVRKSLYDKKALNTELGAQGKRQNVANRLGQARRNLRGSKALDRVMDNAIKNKDLKSINSDRRLREKAWEATGKAMGKTGADLAKFVNDTKNKKYTDTAFKVARSGKWAGVQRSPQLQTRKEAATNAIQAEFDAKAGITKGADGKYYNADGSLATNRRTVTSADLRARSLSDKQKRLNDKQLNEMLKRGEIKNDSWMKRLFDQNGKLLEGDALSNEFNTALASDKSLQKYSATANTAKGMMRSAFATAGKVGSTLVNPWKLTDAIQGGLATMRAKPNMFGTVMDAMFDPDNGIFYESKLGKLMDGFSYHKTFKELDKWENAKKERKRTEGYASARTYRFANAFADNAAEIKEMDERERKREVLLGKSPKDAEDKLKKAKIEADAASDRITKDIIAAGQTKTGRNTMEMGITKALGNLKQGDSGYNVKMKEINNMLNTGDKKGFTAMFGELGSTMYKMREEKIFNDKGRYEEIQKNRKIISEYKELESMAKNEKGEFISQEEYIKSNQGRRSRLKEYMDSGMRILGISEADREELGRLRAELTSENGIYINAKRAFENGEKPIVQIDGKDIKLDCNEAFQKFQDHMTSAYEKAVQSKIDFHAVAFRDYGEKTGDRMDGVMGAMMASEQVKLMQDTIQKTDKNTHQLFHDPAFVEMLSKSKWQSLSDQFMKASRGEECVFDKGILAGVSKPQELEEIGKMFRNMMGNADGEMRGAGYSVANNIIAKTFRMAFVDQINESLKVTAGMLDNMQTQAQRMRDSMQRDLQGLQDAGMAWQKAALKGFDVMNIGEGQMDPGELDRTRKEMLEKLERTVKERREKGEEISDMDLSNTREKILQLFSQEMEDRRLRRETNEMNWTTRFLTELDFLARNAVDRKDDNLQ